MKSRFLALALLGFAACADLDSTQEINDDKIQNESLPAYEEGEVRVLFSEEMAADLEASLESGSMMTKSSQLNDVFAELGITSARRLFPHAGEYEERTRREGLHRWYVVEFDADLPVTKAEAEFISVPGVEITEPIRKIRQHVFDDLDSRLWGLNNQQYPGVDINVMPAWQNYTTGTSNVIVAVVDDGIDLKHEDLASNCAKEGHYNFVDQNTVIVPGTHGTHVAGTIAGVSNNGKGVAGIAGGDFSAVKSGVTLLSCQIFKTKSDGTTQGGDSAAAIKWGADHGAIISQNSWGYDYDANNDGILTGSEKDKALAATISPSLRQAVDYFIKYAGCDNAGNQLPDSPMKGGVVIFAAGNDGIENGAPANYEPIVAVGAINEQGEKTSFSCYGSWVDICAPGNDIYSTLPSNEYGIMSGTSMACPHVSGAAALIVSYYAGQGFTNEMLIERLKNGSNKSLVPASAKIGGLVDVLGSLSYGSDAVPEKVDAISVSSKSNFIDLSWTVGKDTDNKPVYGYYVFYSTDEQDVQAATVENHANAEMSICVPGAKIGETAAVTLTNLRFETTYYIKIVSYAYNMIKSEDSDIVSISTEPNNPPVINVDGETDLVLRSDKEALLAFTFSEPDGHKFEIKHVPGSQAETFTDNLDGRWLLNIKAAKATSGKYVSVISAVDEFGCEGILKVNYEILPNFPPVILKDIDDMIFKKKGTEFTLDLNEYFNDEDGEVLKYDCTVSNEKVLHLHANGSMLYGTVTGYGVVDASVTAVDAKGESAVIDFKVAVRSSDKPVDLYPVPVTDHLCVATEQSGLAHVIVKSSVGQIIVEKSMETNLFNPAVVDMKDLIPGVYSVTVTIGSVEYKSNVVKL